MGTSTTADSLVTIAHRLEQCEEMSDIALLNNVRYSESIDTLGFIAGCCTS
ncbi:MAG: hypothetical protein GDA38_20045 [Hormoscilla sp. SP12CHS1]|nr:hypothetical protein [Hormoscilla sp. SP12CHS1]